MKKLLVILFICLSVSSFSELDLEKDFEIIGKWIAEDETVLGYFTFDEEGFALIETQDRILGGKKFEQRGMEFSLRYTVDYETNPINLDLTFTNLESGRQLVWPCIIRIIDNNEIVLARGENGERPEDFLSTDYQVLKRVK